MDYIIGVDAGGTKTEAVAFLLNGDAVSKSISGFGNLLSNREQALNNIEESINNIVLELGIDGLKGIYVGAAGAEVADNQFIIQERLINKFGTRTKIMNDGQIALKAKLQGEDGMLVIAGTGSIVIGIKEGKTAKCGGWGNLIGDEGSGYKIAIDAIKQMIKEYEENIKESVLSKKIKEYLNITSVNEITKFVYSSTKDDIAALAPIVSQLAENGDNVSIEILKKEAESLVYTVENLYKKLKFEECKIAVVGGVIKKSVVFRSMFEELLTTRLNILEIIDNEVSPAKGAYYIHIKENEL